jgi:hypothetical protein
MCLLDRSPHFSRILNWLARALIGIVALGCARVHSNPSSNSAVVSTTGEAAATRDWVIAEGFGVPKCHIGGKVQDLPSVFGEPDKTRQHTIDESGPYGLNLYYKSGVEVVYQRDEIKQVYFWFLSSKYARFQGRTSKGIGSESKIADVTTIYGAPSERQQRVTTEYSERPGAIETTLEYSNQGIRFSFSDDLLEAVEIFPPRNP